MFEQDYLQFGTETVQKIQSSKTHWCLRQSGQDEMEMIRFKVNHLASGCQAFWISLSIQICHDS